MPPLLEAASGNRCWSRKTIATTTARRGSTSSARRPSRSSARRATWCCYWPRRPALFANYVPACLEALAPVAGSAMVGDVRAVALSALPALVTREPGRVSRRRRLPRPLLFALDACLASLAEEDESEPLETACRAFGACLEAGCRRDVEAKTFQPLLGSRLDPARLLDALHAALAATLQRRLSERRKPRSTRTTTTSSGPPTTRRASATRRSSTTSARLRQLAQDARARRTHALLDGAWAQRLAHMAQPQCLEEDRRFAVYVVCDALEFGPGGNDAARSGRTINPGAVESCAPRRPPRGAGRPVTAGRRGDGAADPLCALRRDCGPRRWCSRWPRPDASATAACLPVEGFGDDDSDYEDVSDDEWKRRPGGASSPTTASALARVLVVSCPDAGAWALWVQYMPLLADCTEADAALTCLCEGIRTSSLPRALNLVVSCLGGAPSLSRPARTARRRGDDPHRVRRRYAAAGGALAALQQSRAPSSRRCPTTRQAARCAL